MDSMVETMVIILASGIGTVLGCILFLKFLFRKLEELDDSIDYDLEWYEYE
jgi:hypothetical protein